MTIESEDEMTAQEAIRFVLDEVLFPFQESNLYDDYLDEYNNRNPSRNFDDDYDNALSILLNELNERGN